MGGIFHVYNRGVEKRDVFLTDLYYKRFLLTMRLFNNTIGVYSVECCLRRGMDKDMLLGEELVDVIAYCLLPNHYHLLVREKIDGGLAKFMSKKANGYTKFFNNKNSRSGFLFQGSYQKRLVDSDEYLLYLTAYINGNPEIHNISSVNTWIWSSYKDFIHNCPRNKLSNPEIIKGYFNVDTYEEYVREVITNARNIKGAKKELTLE